MANKTQVLLDHYRTVTCLHCIGIVKKAIQSLVERIRCWSCVGTMHAGVVGLRHQPGIFSVGEMPERLNGKEEELPSGDAE